MCEPSSLLSQLSFKETNGKICSLLGVSHGRKAGLFDKPQMRVLESKNPEKIKPRHRPAPLPRKALDADLQSPGFGLVRQERTSQGSAGLK